MAKSTAHEALASCKIKLSAAESENRFLRTVRAGQMGIIYKLSNEDAERQAVVASLGERVKVLGLRLADSEDMVRRLKSIDQYELVAANEQVRNLQNRCAALRNQYEAVVSSSRCYGAVAVLAAYAAGVAMQHWFPIAI